MDRRTFLSLSGLTSMSLLLPWGASSQANAAQTTFGGPYFLHMHASGGWDPTMFCDGKLTAGGSTPGYENKLVKSVKDMNGIMVPTESNAGKFYLRANNNIVEDPQHFFENAGKEFLVFNGVDTQTNSHETGTQGMCCGHNDIELPALAALYAGLVAKERDVPLGFLAGGAYNRTGDVVGASRFPGDKIGSLVNPFNANAEDEQPMLGAFATKRILEMRNERTAMLENTATLPRTKRTIRAFRDASRGGEGVTLLKSINDAYKFDPASLNAGLSPATRDFLSAGQGNGNTQFSALGQNLEVILRCFAAGVSVSATFQQGGFDTHAQHDVNQQSAMGQFVARIRYVMLRAQQLGLGGKLFVLVTSDFGRTPRYNMGEGKDHWNVTSAMLAGPGIRGGRAIGRSDESQRPMRVLASDVSKTVSEDDDRGQRIHGSTLHREMRRVLGVDKAAFIGNFPLNQKEDTLPLLA
jgi:hypothetical protein